MKKVISVIIFLVLIISSLSALAETATAPTATVPPFDYTVLSKYDNYEYDKFEKSWSYYGAYVKEFSDGGVVVGINVSGDKQSIAGAPILYAKCLDLKGSPMYTVKEIKIFVDDKLYSYTLIKGDAESSCVLGDIGKQMVTDIAKAKEISIKITFDYNDMTLDDITMKDFSEVVAFCKNILKHNVFESSDPTFLEYGNTLFSASVE